MLRSLMVGRRDLRAVMALAALGWRQALSGRAALFGRALLYVVVLAIFAQLWRATPLAELPPPAPSSVDLVWYLAITEWIVFAAGQPYREIEWEIRGGDVAAGLLRPLPYGLAVLARWAGGSAFYLAALGGVGIAAGWWLTGTVPLAAATAPMIVVAGVLAALLVLLCQLQLGYAAAWLGSAAPAFWVWQKLAFVLGGLLMPLSLYPAPWNEAAALTPFASMLFGPGSLAFDASGARVAAVVAQQLVWLGVLGALAALIERATIARFLRHGI